LGNLVAAVKIKNYHNFDRSVRYFAPFGIRAYTLEGQVPESKIEGEKVDISTIAEYAWYEWVKFRDTAAKFPVSKVKLGRDLGAAIDIDPAITRKILKQN
jgi:hypothetical protein